MNQLVNELAGALKAATAYAASRPEVLEQLRSAVVDHLGEAERELIARLNGEICRRAVDERRAGMTDEHLHAEREHPEFEYATTEGPRKAWDRADEPPEGDGWVRNVYVGDGGWERFEYTEESYWMRRNPSPYPDTPGANART